MTEALWKKLEHSAVKEGLFNKGGYMNIREYMQERAREEARREAQKEWWQKGRFTHFFLKRQKWLTKYILDIYNKEQRVHDKTKAGD